MMTCRTSGCDVKGRNARSSIGTPRIGRNCFASPGPARTPAPAATTTTPTSGGKAPGELTDSLQPDDLEIAARPLRAGRQEHAAEPLPRRFDESPIDTGDRADFAAKTYLAEEQCICRDGAIVDGGDKGGKDGKVGGRFDQAYASSDVDEYVETSEGETRTALEDREQQREPAVIEAGRNALRRSETGFRYERLDLHEHRPGPFHQCRDRRAGRARRAPGQKRRGGVCDRLESRAGHAKHTNLIDRTEAVLHGAQDPVIERGFSLEVEHGVDDVLERLRSRNAPALGDVPDEQYRRPRFLGEPHQPGGALADLADVARGAFELFSVGRLHRVEQDDARLQLGGVMQNGFEARLAEDVNAAGIFL